MTDRTAALATLGCKTNQFESAAMRERLEQAGYRIVPFEAGADLVVVNTCTVTAATDAQSRNLVRRARRMNPSCRVVVTGCYAQIDPGALAELPGVSVVIGNEEKRDLLDYLDRGRMERVLEVGDIRRAEGACVPPLSSFADRSRAFVQIQNGCDAYCSYCIIPHARGPSRSVPVEQVLKQVENLAARGFPEIVLTGIHIGGYGSDLDPRQSLTGLLGRLEQLDGLRRLRLGSVEPTEIDPGLVDWLESSPVACPHLHIPLQSGDDHVLRRMNRHYTREDFRTLVADISRKLPEAAIGVDVITGFPGETETEFENTLDLVEFIPVTHLHVFPFSRRPGTPAADMKGQVPTAVAKERAARLRRMGEEKLRRFSESFVGRTLEIVVQGRRKDGSGRGLTRNYLEAHFSDPDRAPGSIALIRVAGATGGVLQGRLIRGEGN